jgi:hypothetical protein
VRTSVNLLQELRELRSTKKAWFHLIEDQAFALSSLSPPRKVARIQIAIFSLSPKKYYIYQDFVNLF